MKFCLKKQTLFNLNLMRMLKHFKTICSMLLLLGLSTGTASASSVDDVRTTLQDETCKGVVKDATGEPIIGASVIVKGTTNGTITDLDGNFSLPDAQKGDIIQISFVGYQTIEQVWNGKSFNITLQDDTHALDEVVVVGFGTQKKVDLTGAVSQVKMEDVLGDRPIVSASAALQGAMPGLMVSGSSSPGQAKSFNIRGTLSINGGSPLVLIDNVEGDINALNPDDIESVSVLKDAASAAIYGARAAGGVILVTTKRPKNDTKFQFNYSFNQGWEKSLTRPKQAALADYITAYEEAGYSSQYWAGNGQVSEWKNLLQQYKAGTLQGVHENGIYQDPNTGAVYYLKEGDVLGNALDTGSLSNHNISVSGGTDKLRFRISGNYSYENGPMITDKDKYTRKALTAFISADLAKWFTQEVTMYYTDTKKTELANSIRDPYSTRLINWFPEGYMPKEIIGTNEDYIIDSPRNSYMVSPTSTTSNSIPRIQLKTIIKPLKNWEIIAEYTYNQKNYKYKSYTDIIHYADPQLATKTSPTDPTRDMYTINRETTKYNALNLYTNYKLDIGKHKFTAMLGFNQESSWWEQLNTSIEGQSVPTVPSFGGGTGTKTITEKYQEYAIRGAFGRLTYNFDEKYLMTFNARYDGSSKFPKENRFGFFPSISVGWRVGQEKFMSWANDWLGDFKLRASYGSIGNQNIAPYGFVASMGIGETTAWLDGGEKVTYIGVPGLIRANFTWETVKTLDIGFDLAAFNNRLNVVFDWYKRDTEGMLASGAELPALVGANAPLQNVADMSTKGWEISINWQDRIGDWSYRAGINVYDHTSEITKFNNLSGSIESNYVGKKWDEIWGYVADGYYTIDDFNLEKAKIGQWVLKEGIPSISGYVVQPGDMKFKDLDGNGIIDAGASTLTDPGDRKVIGNSTSRYQFGGNFGVGYKGFDLNVMLQGVGKRDYWIGGHSIFPFGAGGADGVFHPIYSNQTDYWSALSYDPESPDYMVAKKSNPRLFRIYGQEGNVGSNARVSDKYLQDASYLRIKNVTLSYNFPTEWIKKIYLNQLRLYVSVENLATFTSLPDGYDPENLKWAYPFYRTWSVGASLSF